MMSEMIRREDAIKALRERLCGDCKPCAKCDVCDTDTLFRDMMSIHSADAVEVVRCKDCEYYFPYDKYDGKAGRCRKNCRNFLTTCNGFCNLGVSTEDFENDKD